MKKRYDIIYADPPWKYSSKQYQDNNRPFKKISYTTMNLKQIINLPIEKISSDNSVLFIWVTDSHLQEGLKVINGWGFKYKTVAFKWLKKYHTGNICVNYAPWTLKSIELCLLGVRGKPRKIKNNIKEFVFENRIKHSKKPDEVANRIVQLMGDLPRIELFARNKREGWDVFGNEVESDIQLIGEKVL